MKRIVVADSSSNVFSLPGVQYACVPLKIYVDGVEYVDDESLNVPELIEALEAYQGPSTTSCPNVVDWLTAFGQADEVFAVALTSGISGGYNAACAAAREYMEDYPGRKAYVLDSKTTGAELEVIVEEYARLCQTDATFEEIVEAIEEFSTRSHLMFALKKVENFAKNGRVNPLVARLATALDIRIVGQASDGGELQLLQKVHGEKRALHQLLKNMIAAGFAGDMVRLRHTANLEAAQKLADEIKKSFPDCNIRISENRGLCSYYCERGGILVGFVVPKTQK